VAAGELNPVAMIGAMSELRIAHMAGVDGRPNASAIPLAREGERLGR
jgi:hypothetical protein